MIQAVVVFALWPWFGGASIKVLWVVTEQSPCLVRGCEVFSGPVVVFEGLETLHDGNLVPMQYGLGWVVLQEVGLE